jgi:peptidoglycan/LPS O-acetylase OafA/YrhL
LVAYRVPLLTTLSSGAYIAYLLQSGFLGLTNENETVKALTIKQIAVQSSNEWLQGIQYFRAFAIIQVVILHAALAVIPPGSAFAAIAPQKDIITACVAFTAFAVPQFVFISGVVLYNKYNEGFSVSTFYKKRLRSVLPPYIVWSTFYFFYPYVSAVLLFSVFNRPTATYNSLSNIAQLLSLYLTKLAVGIEQLWFVVLIIQLYLLYPLLVKFYNRFAKQKNPIYALSFLLLVQIAFTSLFSTPTPIIIHMFFVSGLFYFVFGFCVSEHYMAIKQKIAKVSLRTISLTVVLSTIYYAVVVYHTVYSSGPVPLFYVWLYQITGPFYCLLLISFYLRVCMGLGEPHRFFTGYLEKIGEDSFGIYLTHMFFITEFAILLRVSLSHYLLLYFSTLALLVLIASYWSVQVLYHLPFSSIIIGKPRKRGASPRAPKQASFTR